MNRKITVPGRPLDVSVVISDATKQVVLAVPHRDEIVVVFVGKDPAARAMSVAEARRFHFDLQAIHEASKDDVKIEALEKEFDLGDPDER